MPRHETQRLGKSQGISSKTAWRWFDQGKLPVAAEQTPTGTILVKTEENHRYCVVYARVSSTVGNPTKNFPV